MDFAAWFSDPVTVEARAQVRSLLRCTETEATTLLLLAHLSEKLDELGAEVAWLAVGEPDEEE